MVSFDGEEVQVKFRDFVVFYGLEGKEGFTAIFEEEGDARGVFFGLEGDDVVVTGALHDLGQVLDVEAEGHVLEASVSLETLFLEVEGNQGNMGGIHSLDGETSAGDLNVN